MFSQAIVVGALTVLTNAGHPAGNVDALIDFAPCGAGAISQAPYPSGTRVFAIASLHMRRVHAPQALPNVNAGVPRIIAQADGDSAVIEPMAKLCAYGPGTALPTWLEGKTPDLVVP